MNIIDALEGEHAAVKALLSHMLEHTDMDHLYQLVGELLTTHAKIEEDLLYKHAGILPDNINEEMIREHTEIKLLLKQAKESNSRVLRQSRTKAFVDKVRHHLKEEESSVFPKAMGNISPDLQNKLEARWATFRKVGE